MTIEVKEEITSTYQSNSDWIMGSGSKDDPLKIYLLCQHENLEKWYEEGGDGITEPPGGWCVSCDDCNNEHLTPSQIEGFLEPDWA